MAATLTAVVLSWLTLLATGSRDHHWATRTTSAWSLTLPSAMMLWLVLDGPFRVGLHLESIRVPYLIVLTVLASWTTAAMDDRGRGTLLNAVVALGTLHALIAVLIGAHQVVANSGLGRAQSTLGNPNALGVVLVATVLLSVHQFIPQRPRLLAAVLSVQVSGILLTQSRIALVEALGLLAWVICTRRVRRITLYSLVGVLAASLVIAVRSGHAVFDARPYLWAEAVERIARHPIAGDGPVRSLYRSSLTHGQPTTYAHNEILQWCSDYGLIGALLAVGAVLATRRLLRLRDPLVACATCCLIGIGATDFGLHITALTLLVAASGAIAFSTPGGLPPATAPATANSALRNVPTASGV